jgi:serine protease Do
VEAAPLRPIPSDAHAAPSTGSISSSGRAAPSPAKAIPENVIKLELGITVATMTDELRAGFKVADAVKGVLVTEVDTGSRAAERLFPGDVIEEVGAATVLSSDDVRRRLDESKQAGKRAVLVLVSDRLGKRRFVALPLE